jgi:hypothetical protein
VPALETVLRRSWPSRRSRRRRSPTLIPQNIRLELTARDAAVSVVPATADEELLTD